MTKPWRGMMGGARGKSRALTIGGALVAIAYAGCAFVLDASTDLGDDCTFDGELETCGSCISSNCQAQVNACCADVDCQSELDLLDDCGDNDEEACLGLVTQTFTSALGLCVAASCGDECLAGASGAGGGGDGGQAAGFFTNCTDTYEHACFCEVVPEAEQGFTACTAAAYTYGHCCGDPGYPEGDAGCVCFGANCYDDGSVCSCGYFTGDLDFTTFCDSFAFDFCCLDPTVPRCECRNSPCQSHETETIECFVEDISCPTGTELRESCNLP